MLEGIGVGDLSRQCTRIGVGDPSHRGIGRKPFAPEIRTPGRIRLMANPVDQAHMPGRSERELALRYDLMVAPLWQDVLQQWFEDRLDLPNDARVMELNCGTGGLALSIASALTGKGEVIAVDDDQARIDLAMAKADVDKLPNLFFRVAGKDPDATHEGPFDLAIGDATLLDQVALPGLLDTLMISADSDGQVALKLITRGSFGEFFSILWEALYDRDLTRLSPGVEDLIQQFPTVSDGQRMMKDRGLAHVHAYAGKKDLRFSSAAELFDFPIIADYLLVDWFSFLPDLATREVVQDRIIEILGRETQTLPFDLSIKTTLLTGRKSLA